jgi:hypothetical protein
MDRYNGVTPTRTGGIKLQTSGHLSHRKREEAEIQDECGLKTYTQGSRKYQLNSIREE